MYGFGLWSWRFWVWGVERWWDGWLVDGRDLSRNLGVRWYGMNSRRFFPWYGLRSLGVGVDRW